MKIPTSEQWRYEGLAESLVEIIERNLDWISQPELLKEFILHSFDKVYTLGKADPNTKNDNISIGVELGIHIAKPIISITDLTEIPEIFEHAKGRWREGICN